jgi:hypothetical protein
LNRVVGSFRISKLSKRFLFDGIKNLRIDLESTIAREIEREYRKNVVMARNARALRNELAGGALQNRKGPLYGSARVRLRLSVEYLW